ncbi:MAG: hypothetical protein EA385_14625 [Salinarimonadaceae bacterium]|nr:MAG: hypothetical protein EA385_14625 [Salinarimonadaceae bacterium]
MTASTAAFRAATFLALAGMALGLYMAASKDHSLSTAHAHLILLGWVSLFLFGLFHRLDPVRDASRAAKIQIGVSAAGAVALSIGVGLLHRGVGAGEGLAVAGALASIAGMTHFAAMVMGSGREGPQKAKTVAEQVQRR